MKKHITELNLQDLLNHEDPAKWIKAQRLTKYSTWLLPQLVHWFGSWKLQRGANNQILCKDTVVHNCKTPQQRALYELYMRLGSRGDLVPLQNQNIDYSALVPLVLYGQKLYQNIPYETWRGCSDLQYVVDPKLLRAMVLNDKDTRLVQELQANPQRILKLREQGLVINSGDNAGTSRPVLSTWKLYGLDAEPEGRLPELCLTMLSQIWVAHPQTRRESQVLDSLNWDHLPRALIEGQVIPSKVTKESKSRSSDLDSLWN